MNKKKVVSFRVQFSLLTHNTHDLRTWNALFRSNKLLLIHYTERFKLLARLDLFSTIDTSLTFTLYYM